MRKSLPMLMVSLLVVCSLGCATAPKKPAAPAAAGYAPGVVKKTMTVNGVERTYAVYVPADYTPKKAWPLIMFLHGAGERGDDGIIQTQVGIGPAIQAHPDRFPCIVVMPQCPKTGWWDVAEADIDLALSQTRASYNVDPKRIYLTGLSMGGFGTWGYGARRLDVYAALMPVCGRGNAADAPALAKKPIWAFHGAKDSVVPVQNSRDMVEAVRRAGGDVRYTEYPELDHNSWDAAYGDADAIRWLLGCRKSN